MFIDRFSVLYIHCVARGLGASFLNKCPASHGGSLRLREHGLWNGLLVLRDRIVEVGAISGACAHP